MVTAFIFAISLLCDYTVRAQCYAFILFAHFSGQHSIVEFNDNIPTAYTTVMIIIIMGRTENDDDEKFINLIPSVENPEAVDAAVLKWFEGIYHITGQRKPIEIII